jgi:hypothetical protein
VATTLKLLRHLGASAERDAERPDVVRIDAGTVHSTEAPYELVKTMRASILVLGRCWPASGGQGVAARRLRHRLAAGGPAHQGPAGHGRRDHRAARLHPGPGTAGEAGLRRLRARASRPTWSP